MTDSQKLDMLLIKVSTMEGEIQELRSTMEGEIQELRSTMGGEIQELRSTMGGEIQELRKDYKGMKADLEEVKNDVKETKVKLDKVEMDVQCTKLILENEIRTNIRRVAEGHLDLSRNIRDIMNAKQEMEELAVRVNMLESEVREQPRKIS